jgi:hypothetical protein
MQRIFMMCLFLILYVSICFKRGDKRSHTLNQLNDLMQELGSWPKHNQAQVNANSNISF